jgi:hypothetical protein
MALPTLPDIGIASPPLSIQKYVQLPGCFAAILSSQCKSLSGHVGSANFGSGVMENVG